jgi:hypothetical protein
MFELFADKIRKAIARDRNEYGLDGVMRVLPDVHFDPETFRIAEFFDCKDWKTVRPGSGPGGDYDSTVMFGKRNRRTMLRSSNRWRSWK